MPTFLACVDWILDRAVDDAVQATIDATWDPTDASYRSTRSGLGDHVLAMWFDQEAASQEQAAHAARDRVRNMTASVPMPVRIGRVIIYYEDVAVVLDPPDRGDQNVGAFDYDLWLRERP